MKTHGRKESWSNSKLVSVEFLYTRDEYYQILKKELKEHYQTRFENECPLFKQINADNELLGLVEAAEVKRIRSMLLADYELRKELLNLCEDNNDMELIVRSSAETLSALKTKYIK